MADIEVFLGVVDRLVEHGNTVIVIEHNLDVIYHADYLVDMGPEVRQREAERQRKREETTCTILVVL